MENNKDPFEMFEMFNEVIANGGDFYTIFRGLSENGTKEKYPYEKLGCGYELRPIVIKDDEGNEVINDSDFSQLYLHDKLVTDTIFRKGGSGGKFKDGYCELIVYVQKQPHTDIRHGFDFGTHVIINEDGNIVLSGEGVTDYPHHYGGNIGKLGDTLYDLRTQQPFMVKGSTMIEGKESIIVNHLYNWDKKVLNIPLGIYLIDKLTCSYKKIDEVR